MTGLLYNLGRMQLLQRFVIGEDSGVTVKDLCNWLFTDQGRPRITYNKLTKILIVSKKQDNGDVRELCFDELSATERKILFSAYP